MAGKPKGMAAIAQCHPEKKHYAQGLCRGCYKIQWRLQNHDRAIQSERRRYANWRKRNPERAKEQAREWLRAYRARSPENRAKSNATTLRWQKKHPDRYKNSSLKSDYGFSFEAFDKLRQEQDGKCAICGLKFDAERKPHVDHEHKPGCKGRDPNARVRGLLCRNCNYALGHFRDNIELLQSAIQYLSK